jgi:hypothetical protein
MSEHDTDAEKDGPVVDSIETVLADADRLIRQARRTLAASRPRNEHERFRASCVEAYAGELSDWCYAAALVPDEIAEVRGWMGRLREAMEMLHFARKVDVGAMLRLRRDHPAIRQLAALAQTNVQARRQLLDVWAGVDTHGVDRHPEPKRRVAARPHTRPRSRRRERSGTARRRAARSSSRSGDSGDDPPAEPAGPAHLLTAEAAESAGAAA